jgi:hypothetical protein
MNPFKYGRVVFDKDFCPRPKLEKELQGHISSAQNVLLEGERRIGKTSLIYQVMRHLDKHRLLYIDIMEIKTVDDLCRRIINSLVSMEQKSGLAQKMFKSLAHLKPAFTFDPLTGTPSLSLDASVKLKPDSIEGLMDLIDSEDRRKNLVVVFDEFQDILNLKEASVALAVLRSKIQFHTEVEEKGARPEITTPSFEYSSSFFHQPLFKSIIILAFLYQIKRTIVILELENIERAVGFIFSRCGFTKEAEDYCKEKGIACSEDERWLESGK